MTEKNPGLRLVADESVDASIIEVLRQNNFEVFSVSEETPSISDDKVLKIATERGILLITEDKDFGELVVRLRKEHNGILLIRLAGIPSDEKALLVCNAIKDHFIEMQNSFSVLDQSKLRIRTFE